MPSASSRGACTRDADSEAGRMLRLVLTNLGTGILMSCLLVGGLLALNPHGLRDLILADRAAALPLLLLGTGFAMSFGVAAIGTALMLSGGGPPPRATAPYRSFSEKNTSVRR